MCSVDRKERESEPTFSSPIVGAPRNRPMLNLCSDQQALKPPPTTPVWSRSCVTVTVFLHRLSIFIVWQPADAWTVTPLIRNSLSTLNCSDNDNKSCSSTESEQEPPQLATLKAYSCHDMFLCSVNFVLGSKFFIGMVQIKRRSNSGPRHIRVMPVGQGLEDATERFLRLDVKLSAASRGVNNILRLHVKRLNNTTWELIAIPSGSIVALNLHSYASGRNPWERWSLERSFYADTKSQKF